MKSETLQHLSETDTYQSVAEPSEGLFKDRGSRFISYSYPVSSEEDVKTIVERLRKEHHAARHCCYAWRLGKGGDRFRANDDGEPSGTAGRPILSAIDSAGVSDTLVVVVRYFGGILLGVPGLVQAYRGAAADALSRSGRREMTVSDSIRLEFGYEDTQTALDLVRSFSGAVITEQQYDLDCIITVSVPHSRTEIFMNRIKSTNDEKGTRIQCGSVQASPKRN